MTGPVEEVVVRCPNCGLIFQDWTRGSINARLDPETAADDGYLLECSTAVCPSCATRFEIAPGVLDR